MIYAIFAVSIYYVKPFQESAIPAILAQFAYRAFFVPQFKLFYKVQSLQIVHASLMVSIYHVILQICKSCYFSTQFVCRAFYVLQCKLSYRRQSMQKIYAPCMSTVYRAQMSLTDYHSHCLNLNSMCTGLQVPIECITLQTAVILSYSF